MEWLSRLHAYFVEQQPFVVATVVAYRGSSPETTGSCIFCSELRIDRFVNSDSRFEQMLTIAKAILRQPVPYQIKQIPLDKIAGTENGYCEVFFEYFSAIEYPPWLKQLRHNQRHGENSTLLRKFTLADGNAELNTSVIAVDNANSFPTATKFTQQKKTLDCIVNKQENTILLLRTLHNSELLLTIIGDHPVADEISQQVRPLPVTLTLLQWDSHKNFVGQIEADSFVIILTQDHELDYQLCETALQNTQAAFVGCIGSKTKAQLFKTRLQNNGITTEQLERFFMPVGLEQISGKQGTVVAASIVAQIMSLHQW